LTPLGRGQEFAGYTIVRLLGSGGMGEVYLAQHPRLPRHDALPLRIRLAVSVVCARCMPDMPRPRDPPRQSFLCPAPSARISRAARRRFS
jgi:serine/threonine protein kinase